MKNARFDGLFPPMITPFTKEGEVDYTAFCENVEHWNQDDLAGYLVNGSNGETAYLTEAEKIEVVKLTVKYTKPGRIVLAGTGLESLSETIRFTNLCASLGAQYALVLTPSYYSDSMTSAAFIDFFSRVADKADIPILLYNVPKFTHVNIKADAVAALAQHPNIIGMKDSTGDVPQLATFKRVTANQDFEIFVGTASAWYPALAIGVNAGVHAVSNCAPNATAAVQTAFKAGDHEKAIAVYQAVFPLNAAVTGTYGIAGLKYACDVLGYKGGEVRCPLQPLNDSNRADIKRVIDTTREQLQALGCHF